LYTQCSHCDTVFQLTADTLRAAGGQVRCGRCGEVFNALARLAEDASAFPTPGESALEMEARADEILHSPMPTQPAAPEAASDDEEFAGTDVEFARLQLIEKFKAPAHETPAPLRRAIAPTAAPPAPGSAPAPGAAPPSGAASPSGVAPAPNTPAASTEPARAPAPQAKPTRPAGAAAGGRSPTKDAVRPRAPVTSAPIDPQSADDGALEFTLPPGELDRIFVDPTTARAHPTPGLGADIETAEPNARAVDESREPAAEHAGLNVAEHVRRDVLAGLRQRQLNEPGEAAQPAARRAWVGAGAVLALMLLGQILHENRTWLAAHGPLRGSLQGLYAALGVKVQPPLNLSAYQLRQWGVTGDPNAAGTLRLRASILNASAQLQPYPLLRVTLANRFGTRIGTRDFDPAEYLGHTNVRLMTPGERADATLDIQDPGKDAEGFEIDVCLRADQAVSCAADAATQAGAPPAGAPQTNAPRAKP
jgi:predicted Zn finger-like uncharacterized protein